MEESKSGFLERQHGKKKAKFMWFSLFGSSLFSYTEKTSATPKQTYELQDATVVVNASKKLAVDIKKLDHLVVTLIATNKEDFELWKSALEASVSQEPCEPPSKEKVKKERGSVGMRAAKAVGGKVTATGAGKMAVKGVVNEETKLLIVALKRIVTRVESQKVANEIEDNLMKIITKSFFLEKDKKITTEQFLKADEPLREAFNLLVEIRDYRHRMKGNAVTKRLAVVHERLMVVEEIITSMLVPYLTPNSIKRIARTFGLLGSIDFLDKAWSDGEMEEERDLLTDAMNRYTQFHF